MCRDTIDRVAARDRFRCRGLHEAHGKSKTPIYVIINIDVSSNARAD
jgi:hypothetical protein